MGCQVTTLTSRPQGLTHVLFVRFVRIFVCELTDWIFIHKLNASGSTTIDVVSGDADNTMDWWSEEWGAFLPETHRVAVVSESLAQAVFPDGAALGRLIQLGASPPLRVVGITRDLHPLGPDHRLQQRLDPSFQVYVSRALWPWRAELLIRTRDDPSTHVSAIRDAVRTADPDLAVAQFVTMQERRRDAFAWPRLYLTVVGFFALISVALATVGLYGVLASSVQGRTREIGLRMALGASREHVRRDVLRRSLVLSSLGLAFGVAAALALRTGARRIPV